MLRTRFLLSALVATAVATLAAKPAHADASVKVPFNFTVDGKQCPAGRYLIRGDEQSNTVTLVGKDSTRIFSWVVVPQGGDANPRSVVLRFDQLSNGHVLRSIQYGLQSTSRLDKQAFQSDETQDGTRGGR
jgi:hypothetical protein